jgi:lipopolysaccharide heptosyltransferase I
MADAPRICLVKLSSLGDVIHALPVARALRHARPRAHVTWVVESREAALLRDHPDVDRVLAVDTRRWRLARRPGSAATALRECRAVLRMLREARFDAVVDLQGLMKSALFVRATRAPLRVGFTAGRCREPLAALATTTRVRPPGTARHVVDQYLALLGPLGVEAPAVEFHVPERPAAGRRIETFLAERGLDPAAGLVAVNPGAGRADKRWPAERFRALAERLVTEAGAPVVAVWGPGEEMLARSIVTELPGAVLAPATDLDELSELLRRCRLVVAGDTGPLHLAAALGTTCLGLFGPTRGERNGPYGPRHVVIQSPDATMAGIAGDLVLRMARERLSRIS